MGWGTIRSCFRAGFAGIFVIAVAVLSITSAFALDPTRAVTQYRMESFDRNDGLPVASVEAIYQASDGYLWIGTHEGVARYDGVRFTTFRIPELPGLARDITMSFAEDAAGTLWIGTVNGLFSFRDGEFSRLESPHLVGRIRELFVSRDGTLWVGNMDGPLTHVENGEVNIFQDIDGNTVERISDFAERSDGTVCFAAQDVSCLEEGRFRHYRTVEHLPNSAPIIQVAIGPDGAMWVGTNGDGILEYRGDDVRRWTVEDGMPGERIRALTFDRNGDLWIGTITGNGVARFRGGSIETIDIERGLPNNNGLAIREDREGNLWVGTQGGGLVRLSDAPFVTWSEREGLGNPNVYSVLEDSRGAIWVGTQDGLNRLENGRVTTFTTEDGLGARDVIALYEDRAGDLWIGTGGGGINRYRNGRFEHFSWPPVVFTIQEDDAGNLWAGTLEGLAVKGPGMNRFEQVRETGPIGLVNFIVPGPEGVFWLGSNRGGLQLLVGEEVAPVDIEGMPTGVVQTAMHMDDDGVVWITTYGGGLYRMKDGRFSQFTVQHGLASDNLLGIVEDDYGRIWVSSNFGVASIEMAAFDEIGPGEPLPVVHYGTDEGMRNEECNGGQEPAAFKGGDGRLWFPTVDGVAVIDPARIGQNPLPPPVHVEQIVVDGETIAGSPSDEAVRLPPGRDKFEFHYTALSLMAPERNRFRYRLEGEDDDWIEAEGRRIAYYTNLSPGRYTFRVLGSNNDGVWNEAGASLSFVLQPYFYQTWWFYVVCVAAAGWAGYGVHRHRVARVLELERVRTRIATDLHDDIGASLSQIAILSEVMQRRVGKANATLTDPLSRIAATSREMVDSMSDIVWAINPRRDRVSDVVQRMRRFASDTLSARDIGFDFRGPPPDLGLRLGADLRRQLYLVFKESINNAVRHSGCKGVEIDFTRAGGSLSLSIRDDGNGFDPEGEFEGNGVASMRRRAEELGGTVRIESMAGQGTTVHLQVPLKRS